MYIHSMRKISKELIAASTVPIVLTILQSGDDYGYSIIKKVQELSKNQLQWKEGSLYPVLGKLEKRGLISSYIQKAEGRNRKYYSLSESGSASLQSLQEEWNFIHQTMSVLWNAKPNLT